MKEIKISMPYIGKSLSCNHWKYKGGLYTRKETKQWMDALGWQLKPHHVEDWRQPITVRIDGVFKNLRSCPDLHNIGKPVYDSIEEVTGLNDRNYKTETGEPLIRHDEEPTILITIRERE